MEQPPTNQAGIHPTRVPACHYAVAERHAQPKLKGSPALTLPALRYLVGAGVAGFAATGGVELDPATCCSICTISWASPEYICG